MYQMGPNLIWDSNTWTIQYTNNQHFHFLFLIVEWSKQSKHPQYHWCVDYSSICILWRCPKMGVANGPNGFLGLDDDCGARHVTPTEPVTKAGGFGLAWARAAWQDRIFEPGPGWECCPNIICSKAVSKTRHPFWGWISWNHTHLIDPRSISLNFFVWKQGPPRKCPNFTHQWWYWTGFVPIEQ